MKEIEKLVLSKLRNDEYFQFMSELDKLILEATLEALGVSSQYVAFKSGLGKVDSALKVEQGSSQTLLISSADDYRDKLHLGLELQVESYQYHWNDEIVEAARRIGRILKQYGNVRTLSYNEESSAITNMVQELTSVNYSADLVTLDLAEWVVKVAEANLAFMTVFNDRANESAARASGNVRAARIILDPCYETLVSRINASVVVNGEEAYAAFIDKVNYYIDYYKATVAARKARTTTDEGVPPPE